jgi:hypothetical protein
VDTHHVKNGEDNPMATADQTNTKQLLAFSSVKNYERRLIILRAEGKPYADLREVLRVEFHKQWTESYIRALFSAGGRLEQAYIEYNEALAAASLKEAKLLAQRASKAAIITMTELMGNSQEPRLRLDAAKALANKYVPDRQVVFDGGEAETDLPDEIANAGLKLLEEAENGSDHVDDPSQGEPVGATVGGGSSEEIPAPVLQEPAPADQPSDTPA